MIRMFVLATIIAACCSIKSTAQSLTSPFHASEGLQTAQAKALTDLSADATLAFIGTLGDFTIPAGGQIPVDLQLGFYLDSARGSGLSPNKYPGQADAWIYLFRSADSGKTLPLVVIKILGTYLAQSFQGFPFPSQFGTGSLDLSRPFSGSGAMTLQLLNTDSTFRAYHAQLPGSKPDLVTYAQLLSGGGITLPIDFLNAPVWTMTFTGGGDTSMTCFVSAQTGQTVCQRIALPPAAVPVSLEGSETASVALFMLPGADAVRVVVSPPAGAEYDRLRVEIVDVSGRRMAETSFDATEPTSSCMVPVGDFARGAYFVVVRGASWSGVAGFVVER